MKFKIGDKIRTLDKTYQNGGLTIGTITSFNGGLFRVTFPDHDGELNHHDYEMELVQPDLHVDLSPVPFRDTIKLKVKKLVPEAVLPIYAKNGDAAMDLTATSMEYANNQVIYGTGLAFEIPENHVGLLFPRSSICKTSLALSNSVGIIDSGYRGEVKFVFSWFVNSHRPTYEVGDRIGQIIIMPYPNIQVEEVQELSSTDRGTGGFGSTNK